MWLFSRTWNIQHGDGAGQCPLREVLTFHVVESNHFCSGQTLPVCELAIPDVHWKHGRKLFGQISLFCRLVERILSYVLDIWGQFSWWGIRRLSMLSHLEPGSLMIFKLDTIVNKSENRHIYVGRISDMWRNMSQVPAVIMTLGLVWGFSCATTVFNVIHHPWWMANWHLLMLYWWGTQFVVRWIGNETYEKLTLRIHVQRTIDLMC